MRRRMGKGRSGFRQLIGVVLTVAGAYVVVTALPLLAVAACPGVVAPLGVALSWPWVRGRGVQLRFRVYCLLPAFSGVVRLPAASAAATAEGNKTAGAGRLVPAV